MYHYAMLGIFVDTRIHSLLNQDSTRHYITCYQSNYIHYCALLYFLGIRLRFDIFIDKNSTYVYVTIVACTSHEISLDYTGYIIHKLQRYDIIFH